MKGVQFGILCAAILGLSACVSSPKKMHAYAPLPPQNMQPSFVDAAALSEIQPAVGITIIQSSHNASGKKKSCSFSSFHRKNTIGYEIDSGRHIAFKASPKVDVWNPDDAEMEFSLRFTKSFGGSANKRPDCTYGSGFYGQIPFLMNDGVDMSRITDAKGIQSFVQERLDARGQRQVERRQRISRGF